MIFIIAQIVGIIGSVLNIFSMQLMQKKDIILTFAIIDFLFTINFILLKGYTGAIVCFVAGIQAIVAYNYKINNKKFPKIFIIIFLIISIILSSLLYKSFIDLLPIICSILYILSIIQNKERNIRLLCFFNNLLWTIYDFYVHAYTIIIFDIFIIISIIIAIIRYDKNNN